MRKEAGQVIGPSWSEMADKLDLLLTQIRKSLRPRSNNLAPFCLNGFPTHGAIERLRLPVVYLRSPPKESAVCHEHRPIDW